MFMNYDQIEVLGDGKKITVDEETDELFVLDNPTIPTIHGDGIETSVGSVAQKVLDAVTETTDRSISWTRVYAGSSVRNKYGENLPEDTVNAIRNHHVTIKDPLTTPVSAGFRSLSIALHKKLDLHTSVRPIYHLDGVPSPVKNPSAMDMVTLRENTKNVYAGIEWEVGTDEVQKVEEFVEEKMGADGVVHDGPVDIGIKPITEFGAKRLIREATECALENGRPSVTLVHKGNITKFTEGAFRDRGYELAEEEFGDVTVTGDELWGEHDGKHPEGKVVVKDRIVDNMLQQLLTRIADYNVITTMNSNGDYVSNAADVRVDGLGVTPGANFDGGLCLAEPAHGPASRHTDGDKVNPTAMILSDRLMLEYMGRKDAGKFIRDAVEKTIPDGDVTYDPGCQVEGSSKLTTGEYVDEVVEDIKELAQGNSLSGQKSSISGYVHELA